jgi:hypothetical protein
LPLGQNKKKKEKKEEEIPCKTGLLAAWLE